MAKYSVTEEQKKQFASIYVLNYMINTPKSFPVFLEGRNEDLEPVLEFMMMHDYIEIKDEKSYIPSQKGRTVLEKFAKRYSDFLANFDIYCAVDLEKGEFAFERYLDFIDDGDAWNEYLSDERWEDLRIAVAIYKKIDPVEVVFMSFINEGRFGKQPEGWQFDLLLGSVWEEIVDICNAALKVEDLGYEDDEGKVTGEEVIMDIIETAADINIQLLEEAKKMDLEMAAQIETDDDGDDDYYVDRVEYEIIEPRIYERYRDPYYVNPVWLVPLFLL